MHIESWAVAMSIHWESTLTKDDSGIIEGFEHGSWTLIIWSYVFLWKHGSIMMQPIRLLIGMAHSDQRL